MTFGYRKYRCLLLITLSVLSMIPANGQKEKKYTRQGNRDYSDSNFESSEMLYRRAIDVDPSFDKAIFNLGNALYKQEKYEEAIDNFGQLSESEMDKDRRAGSFYNLGNSLLKAGKIEESIEAYKDALRNNPGDVQAKYNLAYAQDLLKQQQQQQQQEQQQDQNDKQDQDKQNDQQDESGREDNQDRDQQQQEDNQSRDEREQQQPPQMSKEDAERLLQALAENEKEVQEKVKKAKAAQARVRTVKNW